LGPFTEIAGAIAVAAPTVEFGGDVPAGKKRLQSCDSRIGGGGSEER
jgi:hypothetical protein